VAGELKYAEAIREALADELASDPDVVVMGQEIEALGGVFTTTQGLADSFTGRVLDTPLAESATVGWAIGAAMAGMRPVVEIMFMDFITTAMDQIVNGAAKLRYMSGGQVAIPIVIRTPSDAGTGHGPQHSQHLETWFAHVPGLVVAMPSTVSDAYWMLRHSIQDDNPVVFVESKYLYFRESGEIGTTAGTAHPYAARITRSGSSVTIVTAGRMVAESLAAAESLATEGIDCEVMDLRFIWPYDREAVAESVERTNRLIVVHEAVSDFGWGGEICSWAASELFYSLDAPIRRVATPRAPVPFGAHLESALVPDRSSIESAVRDLARH
jgi:pyruvate dehydrogenase E1 component beta subunit